MKNNGFETRSEFSLQEWKVNEKEVEEFCWVTTKVTGLSHWGWSGSSVLEFGFNWTWLLTHTLLTICRVPTQVRLEQFSTSPHLPESNSCESRGVSVVSIFIDLNVHCAYWFSRIILCITVRKTIIKKMKSWRLLIESTLLGLFLAAWRCWPIPFDVREARDRRDDEYGNTQC